MNFKGNIGKMMQQAQALQEKMQAAQQEISNLEIIGESGGGMVKVHMLGNHDVKKIAIDDSIININEKEILEDMVAAGFNDAVRKLEKYTKERMASMTAGMDIPKDLSFPEEEE